MPALPSFRHLFCFLFLVLAGLVSGCGGGGSAGSAQSGVLVDPAAKYQGVANAAVPTAANAEALAMGAFAGESLGAGVGSIGRAEKGVARAAAKSLPVRELVQVLKLSTRRMGIPEKAAHIREKRAATRGKVAERAGGFTVTGDQGGSATYQLEINDATGNFYGTVTYQGFTSRGTVSNGTCDVLGTLDPSQQDLTQLTLSFSSLSIADANDNLLLSGTLSWAYTYASSSDTVAMNLVVKDLSNSKTYWYKNYQIVTEYQDSVMSQTISGRYYDHDLGFVDLSTVNPVVAGYGAPWPSQGTLVNSASGRWIKVRFQSASVVLEADTNGDGSSDWQVEHEVSTTPPVNHPPVADAGPAQSVNLGAAVQLDGRASSDPDGDTLSYSWSVIGWPQGSGPVQLTGSNTATPSFTPTVTGSYQLQLAVFDGSAGSYATVTVTVSPAPPLAPTALRQTWQFGTYGSSIGRAGLYSTDLDGDGVSEIIATCANSFWYVVRKTGSGYEQVWRSENYDSAVLRILLADLNGDGKNDILVVLSNGSVRMYDGPTLQELRRVTVPVSMTDLAVADLDGDGHLELVTTDGSTLRVYNAETGALKWSKTGVGGYALAVGQTDADAGLEIVTTGYGSKGYVIDGITGATKWEYLNGFGARVRLADLDGDGRQEIVAASGWYKITIFDADLKSPAWEISTNQDISAMEVVDTDGDGVPEILYGDGQWGKIHAVDARSHLQRWSVTNPGNGAYGIAFGDVDQDGNKEVLWGSSGATAGGQGLYIANPATGTVKWQSPDFSGLSALALGDLKNDGSNQLLMISEESSSGYGGGIMNVFDLPGHTLATQKTLGFGDWMGDHRSIGIGDLDGDGKKEFVTGTSNTYDGFLQVYDGATRAPLRRTAGYDGNYFSALALGDVDGDGKVEIVAGQGIEHSGAKGAYLIVFDGVTMQEKWKSIDLGGTIYNVQLADLDKDGHREIIATLSNRLVVFDGVTHVLKLMAESPARALEVADIDGDGFPEILVGRSDGKIDIHDGVTFAVRNTVSTFGTAAVDALKVADLDGSGKLKWLVASNGVLTVLEGQKVYWRSGNLGSGLGKGNCIAVQDTDHDGRPNIFIGTWSVLYQFKFLGADVSAS